MTGVKQPSYEMESYVEEERTRGQERPKPNAMKLHPGFFHTRERERILILFRPLSFCVFLLTFEFSSLKRIQCLRVSFLCLRHTLFPSPLS